MESDINAWRTIPGETPIDPSYLKDHSITTRGELCRAEAQNIRKVFVKYLSSPPTRRRAPFDYAWFLRLHKEMYCDVWTWAGQLRQVELTLGIKWRLISQQVFNLTQDLPVWGSSGMSLIEMATRLHHRAVCIHPFMNGNGRWARLLANIWLGLHKSPIILWPEETIGQESSIRKDYIKALKTADAGDYGPLLDLHSRYLKQ
jgi:Fic-DOC domain mobile mystery protein B